MSQNDMNIADGTGAAVLADLNSAIQALASTSKGPTAPATPYAGQLWLDDDTPSGTVWTLKQYDGADWITLGLIDSATNAVAFGGPSFQAHKNGTDQTAVTAATFTKVSFTTEEWDTGGHYDATNSKFLPTVAGKYRISAAIYWKANIVSGEEYLVAVYKNGSAYKKAYGLGGATASLSPAQTVTCLVTLNGSTDYVEIFGFGGGAGNKTVSGDTALTYFSAEYVGP